MLVRILLGVAIGALLGALLGSTRTCADGGCPLTANWKRGSLWGAGMGLLVALALTPGGGCKRRAASVEDENAASVAAEITSPEDFAQNVARRQGMVLVYFYTKSCGACAQYRPAFERVARRLRDQATFAKIDAARLPELARRYGVEYVPTTLLFEDGREVERLVGIASEEKLAALFESDTGGS